MADLFLSYKREDAAIAQRLRNALENAGYSIWMDTGIRGGRRWDEEVEREIREAKGVVVVWTPRSVVTTSTVRDEALYARQHGKLVSVLAEPSELPLMFQSIQYNDLSDWDHSDTHHGWLSLIDNIERVFSGESIETSLAAPSSRQIPVGDKFRARINWNHTVLPPPEPGEIWSFVKALKSETEKLRPSSWLMGGRVIPKPYQIRKAFWARDKIYALGETTAKARDEQIIMRASQTSVALGNLTYKTGPIVASKKNPSQARISMIAPGSPDKDWLLITDYRRATVWIPNVPWGSDTHDAFFAEIGTKDEGIWKVNRMGEWPDFGTSPCRHEFGDNYHSNGHFLKMSPDGSKLAHWRGEFQGPETASAEWQLDIFEFQKPDVLPIGSLTHTARFSEESWAYVVHDIEFSPSSRFVWLDTGRGALADLKTQTSRNLTDMTTDGFERIFQNHAWHGQKDLWAEVQAKHSDQGWVFRVSILNLETNEYEAHHELEHKKDPHEIAWSADGRFIATGSLDQTIEIWDLQTDKVTRIYGKARLEQLTFSPDGQRLLVRNFSGDSQVSLLDPSSGSELFSVPGYSIVGWKNNARTFAILSNDQAQIELYEYAM